MEKRENELRSEKVRALLGERPPLAVRWGTGIIAFIFAVIIAVICTLPYPYSDGESILEHFMR